MKDDVILQVKDLKTYFFDRTGKVPAVDGVDFTIRKGETLGIVGESGIGKERYIDVNIKAIASGRKGCRWGDYL